MGEGGSNTGSQNLTLCTAEFRSWGGDRLFWGNLVPPDLLEIGGVLEGGKGHFRGSGVIFRGSGVILGVLGSY